MSQLSPAHEAALKAFSPLVFVAVEIQAPAGTLRLLDGASEVTFGGRTFVAEDPTFGALGGVEAITDSAGDEAPSARLLINTPTLTAAQNLATAHIQGAPVYIWTGAISTDTGAPAGDPFLLFAGEVDVPTLQVGVGARAVGLDCVSIWERLFDDFEGVRLTNAFHQSVWPGELGLEFVTDITRQLPWGADAPRPNVISDAPTTPAGGFQGGGGFGEQF